MCASVCACVNDLYMHFESLRAPLHPLPAPEAFVLGNCGLFIDYSWHISYIEIYLIQFIKLLSLSLCLTRSLHSAPLSLSLRLCRTCLCDFIRFFSFSTSCSCVFFCFLVVLVVFSFCFLWLNRYTHTNAKSQFHLNLSICILYMCM